MTPAFRRTAQVATVSWPGPAPGVPAGRNSDFSSPRESRMPPEPSTAVFAGLLAQLREADTADRPDLINRLVGAAVPRVRRLTRAIIRGRMALPGAVETDEVL